MTTPPRAHHLFCGRNEPGAVRRVQCIASTPVLRNFIQHAYNFGLQSQILRAPHMSTLKDRISELMRATHWNTSTIARKGGISPSAVSQWRGIGQRPVLEIGNIEVALRLQRESGFSALWLAKGIGPKMASDAGASINVTAEEALKSLSASLARLDEKSKGTTLAMIGAYLQSPEESVDILALLAKRLAHDPLTA